MNGKFQDLCRIKHTYFRHPIKLGIPEMIGLFINSLHKTLQIEIKNFFKSVGEKETPTKQAFSKARMKLSEKAFVDLNQILVGDFYADGDFKTWKGFRRIGIDGSTGILPESIGIIKEFGVCGNQHELIPMARISMAFDLDQKLTLDARIGRYNKTDEQKKQKKKIGERELALLHLEEIIRQDKERQKKQWVSFKDLFLMDMGYPALELLAAYLFSGKDFLIRSSTETFQEVKKVLSSGEKDQIVSLDLNKKGRKISTEIRDRFPEIPLTGSFNIRVLQISLPTGETEVLLTSLTDQEVFPYEDFPPLYQCRWGSETNYDLHKNILQLENFTGLSTLSIKQDFHATVFLANIQALIHWDLEEKIEKYNQEKKEKGRKYDYQINRNTSLGFLKDKLFKIVLGWGDMEELYEEIQKDIFKNKTPIRPNRRNPRNFKKGKRKYFMNQKKAV